MKSQHYFELGCFLLSTDCFFLRKQIHFIRCKSVLHEVSALSQAQVLPAAKVFGMKCQRYLKLECFVMSTDGSMHLIRSLRNSVEALKAMGCGMYDSPTLMAGGCLSAPYRDCITNSLPSLLGAEWDWTRDRRHSHSTAPIGTRKNQRCLIGILYLPALTRPP